MAGVLIALIPPLIVFFVMQKSFMRGFGFMRQIKALILDYGGVISRPQDPEIVETMFHTLGLTHTDFKVIYRKNRAAYDSGQETATEYWRGVLKHFDIEPGRVDISKLIQQDVKSWTRINDSMRPFEIITKYFYRCLVFMKPNGLGISNNHT